jgi:hypothetical protein
LDRSCITAGNKREKNRRGDSIVGGREKAGVKVKSFRKEKIMKATVFWIFGVLQSISLGMIVFLVFRALNLIYGEPVIGLDAQIVLSISFPLFILIVEYIIYKK